MRSKDKLREQIEALDPSRGAMAALERHRLVDVHFSAIRAVESAVLEHRWRLRESSTAAAQIKAVSDALSPSSGAIEQLLSPSRLASKYLEDLTGSSAFKSVAEQALKWTEHGNEVSRILERFREPIGISSARALLESMAKASEPFGVGRLLEDAVEAQESEEAREEADRLVQIVTDSVSKALTVQEGVDRIVLAIESTKEPLQQKLLAQRLAPILLGILLLFLTPVADFYVKRWLEGASKQEANKQVKNAAREACDVRSLNDFRFVSTQRLAVKSGPKARALVVGQLRFGQTVRVLEREGGFSLVIWRSEDEKATLQGWVFSRYLKRFN